LLLVWRRQQIRLAIHSARRTPLRQRTCQSRHAPSSSQAAIQITIGNGNRTTVLTVNIVIYLLPIPRMDEKYRDLYTWRAWLRTVFDGAVTISGNAAQVQSPVLHSAQILMPIRTT
jgi:hypothetical protein